MGVDKSNVRTVVHLSPSASTEAYLQESGQASRDGKGANAWLIWTPEDLMGVSDVRDSSGDPGGGSLTNQSAGLSTEAALERDSGGP